MSTCVHNGHQMESGRFEHVEISRGDRVYLVILNWNGWKDTIECLESVFRSDYKYFKVVVCDNGSTDGSINQIKSWAEGILDVDMSTRGALHHLTPTPLLKPLKYIEYDRLTAEGGGNLYDDDDASLVLIQTGDNLGYAGGNNVGLRYVLAKNDFDYVWLLNNDTVVERNALKAMVNRMKLLPHTGMCGSTLLYYHAPSQIQAMGGATYNKWFGTKSHIGAFEQASAHINVEEVESTMVYVIGASMLVSKYFLNEIGLLSEEYFLYCEEIDWAFRAKGKFDLTYAVDSIVYHKEGASTGASNLNANTKSEISEYYSIRNRIIFTRKYCPNYIATVYLGIGLAMLNRLKRRQWRRLSMIFKIVVTT